MVKTSVEGVLRKGRVLYPISRTWTSNTVGSCGVDKQPFGTPIFAPDRTGVKREITIVSRSVCRTLFTESLVY